MNELLTAVRALPLKEMDGTLLSVIIREEAGQAGMNVYQVAKAIALAAYLHRNQTRKVRGVMPVTHYIEHPLRGALRYLRYGGANEDVLISIILHDTVEDCLDEFVKLSGRDPFDNELGKRTKVYDYIEDLFNKRVADVVYALTNPVKPLNDQRTRTQKREDYAKKVAKAIEDPDVAIAKFVDFVDNAAGLHHQTQFDNIEMVQHLSAKYLPLVKVFTLRLGREDIQERVTPEGYLQMLSQVTDAGKRLATMAVLR